MVASAVTRPVIQKTDCEVALAKLGWALNSTPHDFFSSESFKSVSSLCLRADVEDMLRFHDAPLPQDSIQSSSGDVHGAETGVKTVVCLEGPARRTTHRYLSRLVAAVRAGSDSPIAVIAVAGGRNLEECERGRRVYIHGVGSDLVNFDCVVDLPVSQVRESFLLQAANSTWWTDHEWRFSLLFQQGYTLGALLVNLQMKSRCMDALESYEFSKGTSAEWVIYLRNDYDFFEQHPPLAMMAHFPGIWVADGEDFGGLSDRWAVLHRRHAVAYFRRWEAFLDGRAISYFKPAIPESGVTSAPRALNPELCLLLHLHGKGLWPSHVMRFLPTAALRCVAQRSGCQVMTRNQHGWRGHNTWSDAYSVASRLQLDRWSWALTGKRQLDPPCPPTWPCCSRWPIGGAIECFETTYDFHWFSRCCDNTLLTIVPPADGGKLPSCWMVSERLGGKYSACLAG